MQFQGLTILDESPEERTDVACPHCGEIDNWAAQYCDLTATQPCTGGNQFDSYEVHDQSLQVRYFTCHQCDGLVWFDPTFFLTLDSIDVMLGILGEVMAGTTMATVSDALGARSESQLAWAVEAAKAYSPKSA